MLCGLVRAPSAGKARRLHRSDKDYLDHAASRRSLCTDGRGIFAHMISRIGDIVAKVLDRAGYLVTLARRSILDRLARPPPETPTDTAIREQGERLRKASPQVDFDDPRRHVR
jgi:hypothetical protein